MSMDDLYGTRSTSPSSYPMSSPYLNFDPSILNTGSQFIIPEGQGETRSKMETAFLKIGGGLGAGGILGCFNGLYQGNKEAKSLNLAGQLKRTQILNFVAKQGATSSQALGSIVLVYSLFDWIFSKVREVDDELNMFAAGATAGATYMASRGIKQAAKGGLMGLALTVAYYGLVNKDNLSEKLDAMKR